MKTKLFLFSTLFLSLVFNASTLFGQEINDEFTIPDFFISESSAKIKGAFDGNTENTLVLFEKNDEVFEASILKESSGEITVLTPEGLGIYSLFVEESGYNTFIECPARIVTLDLNIGKTNLLNGEKTKLEIVINGVENYVKPIEVIVKNKSPKTVALPNGTTETITLENSTGKSSVGKNIQITGIKRGTFNIEVEVVPDDKLISYDWEKLYKQFEEELRNALDNPEENTIGNQTTKAEEVPNFLTTTTSGTKKPNEETGTPDSTTCNCDIKPLVSHKLGNTIYTLTKAMEDQKLAKAFRKAGITFPKKNDENFKGQNIPIVPGSAYATGYGDIVGGYANAIATSWGKKPENGTFAPDNFNTEDIEARANIYGRHVVKVTPAPGEWSLVIGVATVSAHTQANAIDPVEFDRKLMKEVDRGKGELEVVATIFGIITDPVGNLVGDIANAILVVTGGKKLRKSWATTNTDVNAVAEASYFVKVNENKGKIRKYSRAFRIAEIVRPTFKDTKIVQQSSSKNLEKFKEGKIIVSDSHPTEVSAIIKGAARVRCKATGNGFSESGVGSKTAVCIVGFCVNEDGALKIKRIHDSGVFVISKTGKEIADAQTTQLEEKLDTFFNNLEKQLEGKSASAIKQVIENDVEDGLITIFENWQQ